MDWLCPFCERHATLSGDNITSWERVFEDKNKYGPLKVHALTITCPNPKCREFEFSISIQPGHYVPGGRWENSGAVLHYWKLVPQGASRVFPDYVPTAIVQDYQEACAIRELSPKASATLARRCIQGMIRDFWGIRKNRLIDEISALEEHVDPSTWSAIDVVRRVGNIGAHMEKDIDIIVDVDPNESQLLISLIETLIQDWYVVRHQRAERLAAIAALGAAKDAERAGGPVEPTVQG